MDVVILRLESPTRNIHNYPDEQEDIRRFLIGILDNHLQMDRDDFLASVKELLGDEDFGITYWDDPWLVFQRGVGGKDAVPDVMTKLQELREKW